MARGDAMEDAEFFELIQRKIEAGEMQPGIDKHAAVTRREDEAVTVDPAGGGGIDLEGLTEKHGTDIGGSERESQMA